jgi:hypothetical protein
MKTSANTNQIQTTARVTTRTTPAGFRRRTMAGTLLVAALTATAVGLAAAAHGDDGAPASGADTTITVPVPPVPGLPWLNGYIDRALHGQIHCGFQRGDGYRCDWY